MFTGVDCDRRKFLAAFSAFKRLNVDVLLEWSSLHNGVIEIII